MVGGSNTHTLPNLQCTLDRSATGEEIAIPVHCQQFF